jgi:putative endopeptidase
MVGDPQDLQSDGPAHRPRARPRRARLSQLLPLRAPEPTAWANWDEIIFPAAYLQPPLYDPSASVADNFGAIGVIIGHEMTHLFTADGGDVDARGRVRHWWTPTDSARFADVQARMIRQFDGYTVLDSMTHVSGSRTVSENLADLGGIELAFAAMQRTLAGQPRPVVAARDTTAEMWFFLAYARSRVAKYRPEHLRQVVKSDWPRRRCGG